MLLEEDKRSRGRKNFYIIKFVVALFIFSQELNHANIINDVLAENAKKEYLHFCNLKKSQLQEIFRPCDQFSDEVGLDTIYARPRYSDTSSDARTSTTSFTRALQKTRGRDELSVTYVRT
uniref:Uncharacterized protein n=1 Tax=Timema monikensis TaxID=170555 RepID=A0A7R9E0F8_9NEOP|nr:unnamed protein product [Timema monikensis]